jgi:DnaJ-domain-containing protein 1
VEVAQGRVADRPFARTIYTISAQRFTGDLVLREGERRYKISWEDGRVVAAESPAPADSPGRVALSAGLVTSTDVSAALERLAKSPGTDVLQILSELARLKPDQVALLKRRLLAQRAARTFALPDALYVLDNARSLRADPEVPPLDARWLVYFGVRTHYTVDRLERELGGLLDRGFQLAQDAAHALPAFAFGEGERSVMDRLAQRAWTPRQLVGVCTGVEGRLVLSVLYALVACDCLEPGAVPAPAGPIARGTETQAPPIAEAAARRARPSLTPAVPGAPEHSGLAHGTVRRLLFPGHGTSPPPAGEATGEARARRASSRPPLPDNAPTEPSARKPEPEPPPGGSSPHLRVPAATPTGGFTAGRAAGKPDPEPPARPAGRSGSTPPSPGPPGRGRMGSSEPPLPSDSRGRTTTPPPARGRPGPTPPLRPHSTTIPPILRRTHNSSVPPTGSQHAAAEVRRMIADKIAALDRGADHYSILGVTQSAKPDEIRAAYFGIAKRIHPDRLRALGVNDADGDAQRLFARINQAFGVLSDPQRRAEYAVTLSAGGEDKVRKAQADAEEKAGRVLRAEETFRRGEMALRRSMFEQARALFEEAVSLNDEEAEYHALLAWATWLSSPSKTTVAPDVQKRLAQALALSPQCVPAHFYGGQIAKQSGQVQAAIDAFRTVIEIEPGHAEANLELRVLRGRLRKK